MRVTYNSARFSSQDLECCALADFFKGGEKSPPQLVPFCNLLFELNSCPFFWRRAWLLFYPNVCAIDLFNLGLIQCPLKSVKRFPLTSVGDGTGSS